MACVSSECDDPPTWFERPWWRPWQGVGAVEGRPWARALISSIFLHHTPGCPDDRIWGHHAPQMGRGKDDPAGLGCRARAWGAVWPRLGSSNTPRRDPRPIIRRHRQLGGRGSRLGGLDDPTPGQHAPGPAFCWCRGRPTVGSPAWRRATGVAPALARPPVETAHPCHEATRVGGRHDRCWAVMT